MQSILTEIASNIYKWDSTNGDRPPFLLSLLRDSAAEVFVQKTLDFVVVGGAAH